LVYRVFLFGYNSKSNNKTTPEDIAIIDDFSDNRDDDDEYDDADKFIAEGDYYSVASKVFSGLSRLRTSTKRRVQSRYA